MNSESELRPHPLPITGARQIVAGIIDEIGIVGKVNELLGTDPREKINCGEVVKAIILNGLGFVAQPLYLFSNFFKDKAVEHLLGAGVKVQCKKSNINQRFKMD